MLWARDDRGGRRRAAATAGALVALALALATGQADAGSRPHFVRERRIENPGRCPTSRCTTRAAARQPAGERGKLVLVTFLYIDCNDVCPLRGRNLNTALRRLGPQRKDVRVLASASIQSATREGGAPVRTSHQLLPRVPLPDRQRRRASARVASRTTSHRAPRSRATSTTSSTRVIDDRDGKGRVLYDATARRRGRARPAPHPRPS